MQLYKKPYSPLLSLKSFHFLILVQFSCFELAILQTWPQKIGATRAVSIIAWPQNMDDPRLVSLTHIHAHTYTSTYMDTRTCPHVDSFIHLAIDAFRYAYAHTRTHTTHTHHTHAPHTRTTHTRHTHAPHTRAPQTRATHT